MVYFVQADDGPIKIGYTQDTKRLRTRVDSMQCGNHHELYVLGAIHGGGRLYEEELHKRFSQDRVRGEWFRPSGALWRVIHEESERVPGFPQRERTPREKRRATSSKNARRAQYARKARQRADNQS